MAKEYRLGPARRIINKLVTGRVTRGKPVGAEEVWILTTTGRRSGQERSTPVTLVRTGGRPWLVAPYGAVGWVHNLRAAGRATVRRGGDSYDITAQEVDPGEAAPVLKDYATRVKVTRPFFDTPHTAPADAFAAEAATHPVFRIEGLPLD